MVNNGKVTAVMEKKTAKYAPKSYEHLIGMKGFSEKLLKDHFKLYEGYVNNTNKVMERLETMLKDKKEETPEYMELKRRFGWEWDGMRMHEYYFDNLGGDGKIGDIEIEQELVKQFGSVENWRRDFTATGAMRGIGWVVLYEDPNNGRLFNSWIEEHNANHWIGGNPLLIMDVFEHAYIRDYGTDKGKYIEAFFNNINWDVVANRCL